MPLYSFDKLLNVDYSHLSVWQSMWRPRRARFWAPDLEAAKREAGIYAVVYDDDGCPRIVERRLLDPQSYAPSPRVYEAVAVGAHPEGGPGPEHDLEAGIVGLGLDDGAHPTDGPPQTTINYSYPPTPVFQPLPIELRRYRGTACRQTREQETPISPVGLGLWQGVPPVLQVPDDASGHIVDMTELHTSGDVGEQQPEDAATEVASSDLPYLSESPVDGLSHAPVGIDGLLRYEDWYEYSAEMEQSMK